MRWSGVSEMDTTATIGRPRANGSGADHATVAVQERSDGAGSLNPSGGTPGKGEDGEAGSPALLLAYPLPRRGSVV